MKKLISAALVAAICLLANINVSAQVRLLYEGFGPGVPGYTGYLRADLVSGPYSQNINFTSSLPGSTGDWAFPSVTPETLYLWFSSTALGSTASGYGSIEIPFSTILMRPANTSYIYTALDGNKYAISRQVSGTLTLIRILLYAMPHHP